MNMDKDFPQLRGEVYFDNAGTVPIPSPVLSLLHSSLSSNLYGNPHSTVTTDFTSSAYSNQQQRQISKSSSNSAFKLTGSNLSSSKIQQIRHLVLEYVNAPVGEYDVVFTQNTTAALKLVAEIIPWNNTSSTQTHTADNNDNQKNWGQFWYLNHNHTSVIGMRQEVIKQRIKEVGKSGDLERYGIKCVKPSDINNYLSSPSSIQSSAYNLFAYPAQCNFSGTRFPLNWINQFQTIPHTKWLTLIDAASYCSTTPIDLTSHPATFAVFSFHKIFGGPSTIGALLIRKEFLEEMKLIGRFDNWYFGGGSVAGVDVTSGWFQFKSDGVKNVKRVVHDQPVQHFLENGTLPLFEILAVEFGFGYIKELGGWKMVRYHVSKLCAELETAFTELRHWNGVSLIELYRMNDSEYDYGPIFAFNLKSPDNSYIGYHTVKMLASINNIHIRGGCFCNPGACQEYLGFSEGDVEKYYEVHGHQCGDQLDVIDGKPTGALRVSIGFVNTLDSIRSLVDFLRDNFISNEKPIINDQSFTTTTTARLSSITIFPIKACGGYDVNSGETWPIVSYNHHTGPTLFGDRIWEIIGADGKVLTQKNFPQLCLIKPLKIDVTTGRVLFGLKGSENLSKIELSMFKTDNVDASEWISKILGFECTLLSAFDVKLPSDIALAAEPPGINIANRVIDQRSNFVSKASFLLISQQSFNYLLPEQHFELKITSFRANFTFDSNFPPFIEDTWVDYICKTNLCNNSDKKSHGRTIRIGKLVLELVNPCTRCRMICIDQDSGNLDKTLMNRLFSVERVGKKGTFGVYLEFKGYEGEVGVLVGDNFRVLGMVGVGDEVFID
ncbi:hypothetical protein HK098_000901 [Nowakowskiella sp. JEL0407]|nr:hypothetical protein HK098_000901 [Nowakowskiella sp. JEL0407]